MVYVNITVRDKLHEVSDHRVTQRQQECVVSEVAVGCHKISHVKVIPQYCIANPVLCKKN